MINWKVRLKSKVFWMALVPAILLLVQAIAASFGYKLDLSTLGNNIIGVINAVFVVLTILGVVTDPTTKGLGDSELALTYQQPKEGK